MRLGIDAQRLAGQRLGVGRYIEYMIRHWEKMVAPSDKVTIFVRDPRLVADRTVSDVFEVKCLRPALTGMTWQALVLSREAKNLDVLFCPSYMMPLGYRGRCVVAIHSVNEMQPGSHPWWHRLRYGQVYRWSGRHADAVIVPAEATKRDLHAYYGIPESRIEVAHQGAPDSFAPIADEAVLRATRKRYLGADRPYILFVGKLSQRRNIPILLEAFAALKKREKIPHALLLFGPNHLGLPLERMTAELGISDSVVQTDGNVASHDDLVPVYSAAALFVHPSLYEGFSMTLVEALACGKAAVTVNVPALREIAEGCAILVERPTVESLSDAMWRVLRDPGLAKELGAKALERSRRFRWDECALRTLEVLRRVAEK
jgi:glycosyltransferase involved in cell wall biosynthesis